MYKPALLMGAKPPSCSPMESLHITTCQPCADHILIPLYWYVLFDWQSKTSCIVFYFLSLHTANFFCFSFAEMGTDQFNCSMVKIVQHKVQNAFVNTILLRCPSILLWNFSTHPVGKCCGVGWQSGGEWRNIAVVKFANKQFYRRFTRFTVQLQL